MQRNFKGIPHVISIHVLPHENEIESLIIVRNRRPNEDRERASVPFQSRENGVYLMVRLK